MQHDETLEPMAKEIMLRAMNVAITKGEATKATAEAEQSLIERVQALKAERNTISRQMERAQKKQQLLDRQQEQKA